MHFHRWLALVNIYLTSKPPVLTLTTLSLLGGLITTIQAVNSIHTSPLNTVKPTRLNRDKIPNNKLFSIVLPKLGVLANRIIGVVVNLPPPGMFNSLK